MAILLNNINYKLMNKLLLIAFIAFLIPKLSYSKEPIISGKFTSEFFDNYTYDSTNKDNEFNEDYLRLKLALKVNFSKNLYLNSQFSFKEINTSSEKIRRASSPDNGDDISFENHALYIKKLNLNYDYKNATFLAGKFSTKFGQSWTRKDNIWIFEEARNNYREDEKLGFASYLKAGDKKTIGKYNFGLAVFNNDIKIFDGSIITRRDGTDKSDGVPGDERGLKSYITSMDINYEFQKDEELSYHFSYINLAVDKNHSPIAKEKIDDMEGYALNMNYKYPFHKNFIGEGFIEYVNLNNYAGNTDSDKDFLTTLLKLNFFNNYYITVGRYFEKEKELGTNGVDRDVKELNFGYKFNDNSFLKNLHLMAGIKREKTDEKTSKSINEVAGVRIRYEYKF